MKKLIIIAFNALAIVSAIASEHPPILSYFPGCDYKVLDIVTERGAVADTLTKENLRREYEQDLAKIIMRLQAQAAALGADALIITHLTKSARVKDRELSVVDKEIVFEFTAEAIADCPSENKALRRPTQYDENGLKGHTLKISKINAELDLNAVIRNKSQLTSLFDGKAISTENYKSNPSLVNKDISLTGDFYGVAIGDSRNEILDKLGYPSAEFKIFKGTESLLYGRRHWLHFIKNKLVSVEFTDQILSYGPLNLIQAKDEFDQFEWRIEHLIKLNTPIEESRELFKSKHPVEKGNVLTIRDKNIQLSLIFDTEYDPYSSITKKYLVGFSLSQANTALSENEIASASVLGVDELIEHAKLGHKLDFDKFKQHISKPIGRIFADEQTYYDILDNHFMIKTRDESFSEINIREDIFKTARVKSAKAIWSVNNYLFQENTLGDIQQQIAQELNIMMGKTSISLPNLQIRLYLDGSDEQAILYAADLLFE